MFLSLVPNCCTKNKGIYDASCKFQFDAHDATTGVNQQWLDLRNDQFDIPGIRCQS